MLPLWRSKFIALFFALMPVGATFATHGRFSIASPLGSPSFLQPQPNTLITSGGHGINSNRVFWTREYESPNSGQLMAPKRAVATAICFATTQARSILGNPAGRSRIGCTDGNGDGSGYDMQFRIGHGYDLHRLSDNPRVKTGNLVLAGIPFTEEHGSVSQKTTTPGLLRSVLDAFTDTFFSMWGLKNMNNGTRNGTLGVVAHSDGDVVMHATADAIFGALGCEDIGQHFPDTSERNKGRNSEDFVEAAVNAAASRGYFLANIDVTLLLETPKIWHKKDQMIRSLASALRAHPEQVNIKAKTGEGCGPVGTGQAVECFVAALLQKQHHSRVKK